MGYIRNSAGLGVVKGIWTPVSKLFGRKLCIPLTLLIAVLMVSKYTVYKS
jgi:hypothetical protein